MSEQTTEEQITYVQNLMKSVTQTLETTRHELEDLVDNPNVGSANSIAEGTKAAARLKTLIIALTSLEVSIVKIRTNQSGAVDGCTPLDLERSRLEIGSRLARLRAAAGAGQISE